MAPFMPAAKPSMRVREDAYYLTYRNRRADWLSKWWEVVNWDYVGERLQGVHEGRKQL